MKRNLLLSAICFGLLPGMAMAAITPLYTETLVNHGYPANLNDGSVKVGFSSYTGTVDPIFDAWCIYRGQPQVPVDSSYNVNVFQLDDPDLVDLLGVSLDQLKAMAWLGMGFDNTNPNDAMHHHVIWAQTRPDLITLTPAEQALQTSAFTAAPTIDPSMFRVAMPVVWLSADTIGQPIMFQAPLPSGDNPVPEPATMALMGAGLGAVVLIRRR